MMAPTEGIKTNFSNENIRIMISALYCEGFDTIFGINDSLEFLKTIPSHSIDLVLSSPPYNIGKAYERNSEMKNYTQYHTKLAREIKRVLRAKGSIAWQVGNYVRNGSIYPLDMLFYRIFVEKFGFELKNRIIWKFEHGLHSKHRLSGRYETISWFTRSKEYTFNLDSIRVPQKYPGKRYYKGIKKGQLSGNPLGKNPGDVWDMVLREWDEQVWDIPNVKANHPEKTMHPAQFPIELAQRLILALSNEGDTVLDPFGGVGSTAIAALSLRRKVISVDKDPEYTKKATERLKALMNDTLKIRRIGTRIYVPSMRNNIATVPKEWLTAERDLETEANGFINYMHNKIYENTQI
jgi:adenine-specific DNA-methyltransferase